MTKRALLIVVSLLAALVSVTAAPQPASAAFAPANTIVGGSGFACYLDTGGYVRCWGDNTYGQLGNGTNTSSNIPVLVSGGPYVQLAAGNATTCAIDTSNLAWCWGYNGSGNLGNNATTNSNVPVAVNGGLAVKQIVVASDSSTCYLTTAGAAYCWGFGNDGRLGTGSGTTKIPLAVQGSHVFSSITFGAAHGCGIASDGTWCWGRNDGGNLGDGTTNNNSVPVLVIGGYAFTSITAGYMRSCGLLSSGAAYCWGGPYGTTGPAAVPGGNLFASININNDTACGITLASVALCWLANNVGQFGNGTTSGSTITTPTPVPGYKFTSITTLYRAVCGITDSTQVMCWGQNSAGLGDAPGSANSLVPLAVIGYLATGSLVTATVDPIFSFTTSTATTCNSVANTAGTASGTSSLSIGHLSNGTARVAQTLNATTNAANGFVVSIRGGSLTTGTNTIASVSGINAMPAAFGSSPRFGYTADSTVLSRFAGPLWAALSATNSTVLSGTVNTTGCLAYQVLIDPTVPAGTYSATVVYTAVPSF